MARAERDAAVDWEERTNLLFNVMPYVLAPLATALVLATSTAPLEHRLGSAGLAAAALVWTFAAYSRPPGLFAGNPARTYVYFAGFLVFAYLLMSRDPLFFIYTITGFIHAFVLPSPVMAIVGVGATSVLINTIPSGGWPNSAADWAGWLTLVAVQTFAIGSFSFLGAKMTEQSLARRQTVLDLENALAENAALHEQLLTQAREAGALDERQRMAAELHDTLSQGLIGIITQLQAADEAVAGSADHDRHLHNAARMARDSLAEARRSVLALGPQPLEGRSLPEALGAVAESWTVLHQVPAQVVTTGDPVPLHPEVEGTLLRTAQEALANVAKHADASRVGLTLSYMGDVVSLDVRDDGIGFVMDDGGRRDLGRRDRTPVNGSATAHDGGGFGLVGMRQRIARVAGTLVVESEPGRGTAVSASVPAIPLVGRDD
jgi:signal transduction histidine kinase